jgi:hypothetical protein
VIVAVIQASVDALTQEAFNLAREVDPEKVRGTLLLTPVPICSFHIP